MIMTNNTEHLRHTWFDIHNGKNLDICFKYSHQQEIKMLLHTVMNNVARELECICLCSYVVAILKVLT